MTDLTRTDTRPLEGPWDTAGAQDRGEALALVILWSLAEPERVGEVALLPDRRDDLVLGRPGAAVDDPARLVVFARQRPGRAAVTGPPNGARISRHQLTLTTRGARLDVHNRGRCPLRVDGLRVDRADVTVGATLGLEDQLLLLVTRRPRALPTPAVAAADRFPFGRADAHGLVGESPAAWALRHRLAFCAPRAPHVLLAGPSGSGKELAARALHRLSPRGARELIARNAATLPEGLVDAELFGNVRDYPNPGMPAREGLIGAADGASLFLDEIGELPEALQAHLLRVLDADGEYQRLGEARTRRADLRLIAATNRPPDELKHDLLARLELRVTLPGLDVRREDVPLLIDHTLRQIAAADPDIGARFFEGWDGRDGRPRVAPRLVDLLVRHDYTHHARELRALLWDALASSRGTFIAASEALRARLAAPSGGPVAHDALTPAQIQACLDAHDGNQASTWRALGLKNRDVLYRLIKKHGLRTTPR